MVIFSEITEKQCAKDKYPHSKAKIRVVHHRATISATAELFSFVAARSVVLAKDKTVPLLFSKNSEKSATQDFWQQRIAI